MKKYFYVYLIVNTLNGKMYIGKRTSKVPPMEDVYMGSGTYLKNAQNKYGMENFEKFILEECESEDAAYKREELYITVLDAVKDSNYYNIAGGGKGVGSGENNHNYGKTRIFSEETKKKMSVAHKGKKLSREHKKKISDATKGEKNPMYGKHRTLSEEDKRKISDALKGEKNPMYGKKRSEETKKKISNSCKNKKQIIQLDKDTLIYLKTFEMIKDAATHVGVANASAIIKVCKGKSKTAYGYKWMYAEDYIKQYGEIPQELKVV